MHLVTWHTLFRRLWVLTSYFPLCLLYSISVSLSLSLVILLRCCDPMPSLAFIYVTTSRHDVIAGTSSTTSQQNRNRISPWCTPTGSDAQYGERPLVSFARRSWWWTDRRVVVDDCWSALAQSLSRASPWWRKRQDSPRKPSCSIWTAVCVKRIDAMRYPRLGCCRRPCLVLRSLIRFDLLSAMDPTAMPGGGCGTT